MFDMEFWIGVATAVLAERTLDMLGYGLYRSGYRQGLRDIEPALKRMEEALRLNQLAADSIQKMLSIPFAKPQSNDYAHFSRNSIDDPEQ